MLMQGEVDKLDKSAHILKKSIYSLYISLYLFFLQHP